MVKDSVKFETAWANVVRQGQIAGRDSITPLLKPLLRHLFDSLEADPISATTAKAAIVAVLRFLTTPEGRTDPNCWAVDLFMGEHWGPEDRELFIGDELAQVLADMGGALHDTIQYSHVAKNFYSTPEQLLERAEDVKEYSDHQ